MHQTQLIRALSITLLLSCTANLHAMNKGKKSNAAKTAQGNVAAIKEKEQAAQKQIIQPAGPTGTDQFIKAKKGSPEKQSPLAAAVANAPLIEAEALTESAFVEERPATPPVAALKAAMSTDELANAVEQLIEAQSNFENSNNDLPSAKVAALETAAAQTADAQVEARATTPTLAEKIGFLQHSIIGEIKQEKPAELQTSSWRYPISRREVDVIAALQETNAAIIKQALNTGDLVKVINQHLGEFIKNLQNNGIENIQALEQVLAAGLIEMRTAFKILELCEGYPVKRAEKMNALTAVVNSSEAAVEKDKAQSQLADLSKCTTARPQDETLILALRTSCVARLLQLAKLQQRMKEGFDQLREFQNGIQLIVRMMPEELKKNLPNDLVISDVHTDDYIYGQIKK